MKKPIQLLPVQLHVKGSTWRVHDAFLWPSEAAGVSPHEFASGLAKDNGLPEEAIAAVVKKLAALTARLGAVWDAKWAQLSAGAAPDVRVMELRVELGELLLTDRVEWDINNLHNSPEEFARITAHDLGLPRHHETTLAWHIRSQLFSLWERSLRETAPQTASSEGTLIHAVPDDWTPVLQPKPAPKTRAELQAIAEAERQQRLQERRERSRRNIDGGQMDDEEDDDEDDDGDDDDGDDVDDDDDDDDDDGDGDEDNDDDDDDVNNGDDPMDEGSDDY